MPKINDYSTPQVGASPNAFESATGRMNVGAVGAATSALGQQVYDTGNALFKQKAQEETSDISVKASEIGAQFAQRIDDETRDGSIDADKITQDLEDALNGVNNDISTPYGRRAYEREAMRLRTSVARSAARGQAQIAGAKAVQSVQASIQSKSSSLYNDPSDFQSAYESAASDVNDKVELGLLPANLAEKLKLQLGQELAKGAIRGWANLNPDFAEKKLNSGEYDSFFDSDVKAQMQSYINSQKAAEEIEARRREKLQDEARKKHAEAWEQNSLPKLVEGTLSTKDILSAETLTADQKKEWLKLAKQRTEEQGNANPAVENEVLRRILLPDDDPQAIREITEISQYLGRGLNIESVNKLNSWLAKSPEGKAMKDNRRQLIDYASARLVKRDSFGMADPRGEQLLSAFQVDLQQAEAEMRKAGKPVANLYNPRSTDYFGNTLDKYRRNPKEIMRETIQDMRRTSTGNGLDFTKSKSATIQRREGESYEAYIKRRREGGG